MCTHPVSGSLRRSLLVLIVLAGTGAATPAAWAQVEQCEANGKSINLNHGGMTANLTGVVRCAREGKPTREIPYVNGKVHGVQKRFGGMGSSDQVVHTEYREGKRNGIQRTFDAKGQIVSEISFSDDRESGLSRTFHANGKVKRETLVAANDQQSLTHDYDEQGRLEGVRCGRQVTGPAGRGTCRYRDYSGVLETFWPGGAVRTRAQFKAGLMDGTFERFDRNGAPQHREEMQAGYVHGTARALGAEGRVLQEAQFNEGVRHGMLKVFHETGKLIEELTFDQGELMRERTYYLNGELRADTQRGNERVQARGYWDNGKLRFEGSFLAPGARDSRPNRNTTFTPLQIERDRDRRYNEWGAVYGHWPRNMRGDGVEKYFYENGGPASEVILKEGRREGLARAWHENGKLSAEAVYAGGRITVRREFDENGVLIKEEEVLEDGSRRRR